MRRHDNALKIAAPLALHLFGHWYSGFAHGKDESLARRALWKRAGQDFLRMGRFHGRPECGFKRCSHH